MAASRLRRLTEPHVLSQIDPERLRQLLYPLQPQFLKSGVSLTVKTFSHAHDYPKIAGILYRLDHEAPPALVDTLFLIDEMATEEGMNQLIDAAEARDLTLEMNCTAADIAVQVALRAPDLLERKHAEQAFQKPRSFLKFPSAYEFTPVNPFSIKQVQEMERHLDQWFEKKNRGCECRIFPIYEDERWIFMIRHGNPLKREESLHARKATLVSYRPAVYDVVIWTHEANELSIHAGTRGERQLYQEAFGLFLHQNVKYFDCTDKYTLDPLRSLGEDVLAVGDIEGIESIKLVELHIHRNGHPPRTDITNSPDVFAVLEPEELQSRSLQLRQATFAVKFEDSKSARKVTVKLPNIILCGRQEHRDLFERCLELRGFVNELTVTTHADSEETLVGA